MAVNVLATTLSESEELNIILLIGIAIFGGTIGARIFQRLSIPRIVGYVAIGILGHRSLRQQDVYGEEVNRAAVIGHHRGIAITERVHDRIAVMYETRRLPDVGVKWQDEPLKVWEVSPLSTVG